MLDQMPDLLVIPPMHCDLLVQKMIKASLFLKHLPWFGLDPRYFVSYSYQKNKSWSFYLISVEIEQVFPR